MDRQNNQKIPDSVAWQNGHLHTENTEKGNILNLQFQSVFTPLVPLSLRYISLMKVQDLVDNKVISPDALPKDLRNSMPLMPDIKISESEIVNLLKNLKPKRSRSRQNHTCRSSRSKGSTSFNCKSSFRTLTFSYMELSQRLKV